MPTLFERVKTLADQGLDAAAIRAKLESEGVSPSDLSVVLGSLGEGPQPRPGPRTSSRPAEDDVTRGTRFFESNRKVFLVVLILLLPFLGAAAFVFQIFSAAARGR